MGNSRYQGATGGEIVIDLGGDDVAFNVTGGVEGEALGVESIAELIGVAIFGDFGEEGLDEGVGGGVGSAEDVELAEGAGGVAVAEVSLAGGGGEDGVEDGGLRAASEGFVVTVEEEFVLNDGTADGAAGLVEIELGTGDAVSVV